MPLPIIIGVAAALAGAAGVGAQEFMELLK